MSLGKAVDADNAKTYLETTLGAALDILDIHTHNGSTLGLSVQSIGNVNINAVLTNVGDVRINSTLFTYRDNGGTPANHTLAALDIAPVFTVALTTTQLTISTSVGKIIPGATSLSLRNNADNADNLILTDAGAATFRNTVGGITTLTATSLAGTLTTAAQPNVTSLGTLTSLTLGGAISGVTTLTATTLAGTLSTAAQPNVTSLGTLTSLTLSGAISGVTTLTATTLAGTLSTAAQPNVTSLGTLTSLTTSGTITLTAAASKIVPGATSLSHRNNADTADNLILTDAGAATFRNTVGGITTLTATSLAGTLTTAAQPNVTSLGTLTSLTLSGAISGVTTLTATTLSGTLSTAAQANVTSLGTLTSLTTSGAITLTAAAGKIIPGATSISHRNTADTADNLLITDAGAITVRSTIGGVTTLTATSLAGTLTTAAQPNVTSVGILAATHLTSPVVDSGGLTITAGGATLTAGAVSASAASATADVTTSETTTSATYTDLATAGPAVTLTTGLTQKHLILHSCEAYNSVGGGSSYQSVAIAGAAAADVNGVYAQTTSSESVGARQILASSMASPSTHTCKYRASANTATFLNRRIVAHAV